MTSDSVIDDPVYPPGTRYSQLCSDRIAAVLREVRGRRPSAILDIGFYPGVVGMAIRADGYAGRLDGIGLPNGRDATEFLDVYDRIVHAELDPFYGPVVLPTLDRTCDLVLRLEIVEHLLDPKPFFALIAASLATDGRAIVSTPNVSSFGAIARLLRGRSNHEALERSIVCVRCDWRDHVRLYAKDELVRLAAMHGLGLVRHRYYVSEALKRERRKGPAWLLRRLVPLLIPWWAEDQIATFSPARGRPRS